MNIRLELIRRFQRPVIYVTVGGVPRLALLDTGAQVPVYIGDSRSIVRMGGQLMERGSSFSGFGGRCTGDMYRIDMDIGGFVFRDLPVMQTAAIDMPFQFILSAPMFSGYSCLIDDRNKVLSVNTYDDKGSRRLRVADQCGMIHVLADTEPPSDDT